MINVLTLGKFMVTDTETGAVLTDEVLRSDMLKKLFVYMLLHRDHPVSVQELTDALWVEDETDNPQGALKNLMYRMRTVLKKTFGDVAFFKTNLGSYSFNDELEVSVDLEEFETLCKSSKLSKDNKKKIKGYEKAIQLYNGDFFEGKGDRAWIVTSATYYHSTFLSVVKELAALYMEEERYKDAENLINRGLKYDNVDETLHCALIRSIIKQGNLELANTTFDNARRIISSALGVSSSAALREVQEELLKMSKGTEAETLSDIHDDMVEDDEPDGAFFCGYPAFKEIYRLESRKASRLGEAEYVLLLTVEASKSLMGNEKTARFMVGKAMKQLEEAVKHSLRIGDVAAKYSDSQFIVLLPTCTYETTMLVAERIITSFEEKYKGDNIEVLVDLEELNGSSSSFVV